MKITIETDNSTLQAECSGLLLAYKHDDGYSGKFMFDKGKFDFEDLQECFELADEVVYNVMIDYLDNVLPAGDNL